MLPNQSGTGTEAIQLPQVADGFYPADPVQLAAQLRRCLLAGKRTSIEAPKIIVAPHAGLIYSGGVAASAFSGLSRRAGMVKRVVLIGPAHKFAFRGIALATASRWRTPLGDIPVDLMMQRRLKPMAEVTFDDRPFQNEHSIEVLLPFLQVSLSAFEIVPMLVGDATPQVVAEALERVWGGPETIIVVSSDLSHFKPGQEAKDFDAVTRRVVETLDWSALNAERACGHRALAGALIRAQGLDMRVSAVDMATSGDLTGMEGKVVGYGAFHMEYAAQAKLSKPERAMLLTTAARVLAHACQHDGKTPNLSIKGDLPMTMSAMRATFVSLEKDGRLRGCIGSTRAHQPLLKDVLVNTMKAAFGDPRFPKLATDELFALDLSVSILSHPRPIDAVNEQALLDDLSPDRDGLIIADQGRSALFLPHVWKQIPDPKIFLAALRQKAGLPGDHWSPTFKAYRFSAEKFGAPVRELLASKS